LIVEKALRDLQAAWNTPVLIFPVVWWGRDPTWLHEGVRLRRGPTAPQHALVSLEAAFKRRPA